MRHSGPVAPIAAVCVLLVIDSASGQARASVGLDAGVAHVRYDRFLPTFAAFAGADAGVTTPSTDLTARGSAVRFESGRHALQVALGASHLAPARGRTRVELAATGAASWYAEFSRFAYILGRARLHRVGRGRGAWLGLALGSTSYGGGWHPVTRYAAGGWSRAGPGTVDASLTATTVGDATYSDLETIVRLPIGPMRFEILAGARMWSHGAGRGVYGEVSLAVPVRSRISAVLSGGRYPTDPIRGTIAGQYLSAGLRLSGIDAGRRAAPQPAPARPLHGTNGEVLPAAPVVELAVTAQGRVLRIDAPTARTVEIQGDFTDWLPATLAAASDGRWEFNQPLPPGMRRLVMRIDGGPWFAPAGTRRLFDEFGTEVGLLTVP